MAQFLIERSLFYKILVVIDLFSGLERVSCWFLLLLFVSGLLSELELVGFAVKPESVFRDPTDHQETLEVSRHSTHEVLTVNGVDSLFLYLAPATAYLLLTCVLP
jgi:hypothetical protein